MLPFSIDVRVYKEDFMTGVNGIISILQSVRCFITAVTKNSHVNILPSILRRQCSQV